MPTPKALWRQVGDQVRPKLPALLDEAEEDVLAYMSFPKEHRAKIQALAGCSFIGAQGGSPRRIFL